MGEKGESITPPETLLRENIMSILSKRLEWDRIVLPGRVKFHSTDDRVMVPVKAKIPRLTRDLNRPSALPHRDQTWVDKTAIIRGIWIVNGLHLLELNFLYEIQNLELR